MQDKVSFSHQDHNIEADPMSSTAIPSTATAIELDSSLDSSLDNASGSTSDSSSGIQEQAFNEALIKLMVLLYQIDGKVTLGEQDYFDQVIEGMHWRSGVSISAFINDAVHQTRVAIDTKNTREYLFSLSNGLNINPAQALEVAMDISAADGNRSEDELELLGLLSNRVLARGITT